MAIGAGALIGAAIASGVMNSAGGAGSAALNYLYSKKLMARQVKYQKTLMDYQHTLNSPLRQMMDLKAAKLNPNLVYQGNPAISTSIASAPSGGNLHADLNPNMDLVSALVASQRMRESDASIKQSNAAVAQTAAQTSLTRANTQMARERLKQEKIKTKQLRDTGSTGGGVNQLGTGLIRKFIGHAIDTNEDTAAKKADEDYSKALRKFTSDSLSGRSGMTITGEPVEHAGTSTRVNQQEIPNTVWKGRYIERQKLYEPTDDEIRRRRQEALRLEKQRRLRNGALERKRQRDNALRMYNTFGG